MNHTQRALAVLRYEEYDRLPIVHFGYWRETLSKWRSEGHLTIEEEEGHQDGNSFDRSVSGKLGFDFNWQQMFQTNTSLYPHFETEVIAEFPDGSSHVRGGNGVVTVVNPSATGIPAHIDHLLKDRASWEKHYKHRYQISEGRIDREMVEFYKERDLDTPLGLHCGSLFGHIRNVLGIEGVSYLYVDDEPLYREIINAVADLCYANVEFLLTSGVSFDFAHFWEDICFKNGPLVSPSVFREYVGPHYNRITSLLRNYGIDIISLDCDGKIDSLIPIWFENGVNTMFPIEVGTWDASIAPWREQYGRELRGVGGMNKTAFAHGRKAIDLELEKLKPLVDLGGYIPCPDHRIPPDAEWDTVRYYCDRMREEF
ncbi:MAG: hypothetical protein HN368_19195 [Spirochaetales bacterium]|jgi:hypothetical protein|nr:hypothetical protein [Spirochaetales bacterium]